jgi:hypothetical protein
MKHYIAIAADNRVVGAVSIDGPNPYTAAQLAEMDPPGVRTKQVGTPGQVRRQKMDAQDNLVEDLETPEIDRASVEDEDFDKLKDAIRALAMAMNDRLETAGLPKITAAEVKENYKQLRGHP